MSYGVYKLKNIGLPVITSIEQFADKVGFSYSFVSTLYERSDSFYKVFAIPKKIATNQELFLTRIVI